MLRNNRIRRIEAADGDVDYIWVRIQYTSDWRTAVRAEITTSVDGGLESFWCPGGVTEAVIGDHDPGHERRSRGSPAHRAMAIGGRVIARFECVTN